MKNCEHPPVSWQAVERFAQRRCHRALAAKPMLSGWWGLVMFAQDAAGWPEPRTGQRGQPRL